LHKFHKTFSCILAINDKQTKDALSKQKQNPITLAMDAKVDVLGDGTVKFTFACSEFKKIKARAKNKRMVSTEK
jgi:hypothetical protein